MKYLAEIRARIQTLERANTDGRELLALRGLIVLLLYAYTGDRQ